MVHAYPNARVYIVEVHPPGGDGSQGDAPLDLLDMRDEDLEVVAPAGP